MKIPKSTHPLFTLKECLIAQKCARFGNSSTTYQPLLILPSDAKSMFIKIQICCANEVINGRDTM